jgi:hypothetical protein
MGSIFKGHPWDKVAEERARKLALTNGWPESFWEMFLAEANQMMLDELKDS